jgi:hypothetical protein
MASFEVRAGRHFLSLVASLPLMHGTAHDSMHVLHQQFL